MDNPEQMGKYGAQDEDKETICIGHHHT